MQETQVQFLGQEDPLEKEMTTQSSILAWEILWTEGLSGLQSMGSQEPGTTLQLNSNNGIANWSKISHQMKKNKSYLIEYAAAAAAAESLQSCPTLCDPIDGSPPGFPVPGILQARALEGITISFSNAGKWKVKVKSLSRVRLFETPWSAAHQAPPSMGFSMQEYCSGVPLPSPSWVWGATNTYTYIYEVCWKLQRVIGNVHHRQICFIITQM